MHCQLPIRAALGCASRSKLRPLTIVDGREEGGHDEDRYPSIVELPQQSGNVPLAAPKQVAGGARQQADHGPGCRQGQGAERGGRGVA